MDYKDASLPIQERVQDLIGRMTTAEKIGQLIQPMGWKTYDKAPDGTVQVTEEFKAYMEQGVSVLCTVCFGPIHGPK